MAYNQLPILVKQGGTGDASVTAYAPICGGTTTTAALQSATTGLSTSGFVLTSTGSSSLPSFQSSGGWNLLSYQAASNSTTLSFNSVITGTYTNYVLLFANVIPVTAAATLNLTISTDNGVNYITSSYQSGISSVPYDSATVSNSNSTATVLLSAAQATTVGSSGLVYLTVVSGSAFICTGDTTYYANTSNKISTANINGYNSGTTTNAFKVNMSSGNISSGTFSLFGISNS